RLYQYLVPKGIRHDLGEFYTPDWLAEYVLRRAGYDGDPSRRVLDPACGSGTFLVEALKIARERAEAEQTDVDFVELVARQFAGFDINPLAAMATKANLILALAAELEGDARPIRLPVYLADAIYSPISDQGVFRYRLRTQRGDLDMAF